MKNKYIEIKNTKFVFELNKNLKKILKFLNNSIKKNTELKKEIQEFANYIYNLDWFNYITTQDYYLKWKNNITKTYKKLIINNKELFIKIY